MLESDLIGFSELLGDIAALYGKTLTTTQIAMWFRLMGAFSIDQVRAAFDAHARDAARGRFMPVPADLLGMLETLDGRPTPEEAWSTAASIHGNEDITVTWTAETAQAWSEVGQSLMDIGDRFNASRAFITKYTELVQEARRNRIPVQWNICLGWDKELRHQALQAAVESGRITRQYAATIHPRHNLPTGPVVAAIAANAMPLLEGKCRAVAITTDRIAEIQSASDRLAALAKSLTADTAEAKATPKPSVDHGVRIVNAAIESGVLTSVREMDDWMTKARNREDVSELQGRILAKDTEIHAQRH